MFNQPCKLNNKLVTLVFALALTLASNSFANDPLPKGNYIITGVEVVAVDRVPLENGKVADQESDTLTHWIRFDVKVQSQLIEGTEELPYQLLNPVVMDSCEITFDRPIMFGEQEIEAGTNLLDFKKFDGRTFSISAPRISPLTRSSVRIQSGFKIPRDDYTVSFSWTTEEGQTFSSQVDVLIDVEL